MRIAVGSLMQESNTLNPLPTTLDAFEADYLWRGAELLDSFRASQVEMSGFFDCLGRAKAEPVPLLAAHACSGGPVRQDVYEALRDELLERCSAAGRLDGILLALHGAMASEEEPDTEGDILERLRRAFPNTPVAASLDLHAHVTPRMVENATLLVGYQTYPHMDMMQTGQRTARFLLQTLAGEIDPVMALAKRPLLLSPVNTRTDTPPLKGLAERARHYESASEVLAVSLFPVQPWLDVPGLGFAALAVTDAAHPIATEVVTSLADEAWTHRDAFEPDLTSLERALEVARSSLGYPVVIGDAGDAPSCGATGDNPTVLRTLLTSGFDGFTRDILLTLCDPPAAAAATSAGLGARLTIKLGHALTGRPDDPLEVQGTVTRLREGPFRLEGPGAHGMHLDAGPVAVLNVGALHLVLTSRPVMEWDASLYRALGLEPRDAGIVFVKSPSHFRAAYEPIAHTLLIADTPGASRCNLRGLHFTNVGYPLYPLEAASYAS